MVYYTPFRVLALTVALTAGAAFSRPCHYRHDNHMVIDDGENLSYSLHGSYDPYRYPNYYEDLDNHVLDRRAPQIYHNVANFFIPKRKEKATEKRVNAWETAQEAWLKKNYPVQREFLTLPQGTLTESEMVQRRHIEWGLEKYKKKWDKQNPLENFY